MYIFKYFKVCQKYSGAVLFKKVCLVLEEHKRITGDKSSDLLDPELNPICLPHKQQLKDTNNLYSSMKKYTIFRNCYLLPCPRDKQLSFHLPHGLYHSSVCSASQVICISNNKISNQLVELLLKNNNNKISNQFETKY